jgi:hypothetical protein
VTQRLPWDPGSFSLGVLGQFCIATASLRLWLEEAGSKSFSTDPCLWRLYQFFMAGPILSRLVDDAASHTALFLDGLDAASRDVEASTLRGVNIERES